MRTGLLVALLLCGSAASGGDAGGAGGSGIPAAAGTGAGVDIRADIVYGHKDGMALVYDVFRPATRNGAAVLYMVSGGWFSRWQPPARRLPMFAGLLDAGFVVIAVHHGSAPRFKVPDAVDDVRRAVRHVRAHAADHGIDATRLGAFGGSAGGHLALMLGLAANNTDDAASATPRPGAGAQAAPAAAGTVGAPDGGGTAAGVDPLAGVSDAVAAVVAFYPPVDLRPRVGPSQRFPALDFPRDAAAAVSPILFVDADDPPVRLVHGTADDLVPLADSESLQASLRAAGRTVDLVVIDGGDHGFRDPRHRERAMAAMVDWFSRHLAAGDRRAESADGPTSSRALVAVQP
jgi:acetyl esterase/lipase